MDALKFAYDYFISRRGPGGDSANVWWILAADIAAPGRTVEQARDEENLKLDYHAGDAWDLRGSALPNLFNGPEVDGSRSVTPAKSVP
jgi:hypothetical protein